MAFDPQRVSTLLDSMPAVFQEDRKAGAPNFLGRFLLGFEEVLLGSGTVGKRGLEETIARLYTYFEPGATLGPDEQAPKEFLRWLAGWVALTLREDWEEQRQRDLIARAASLYRHRGTKRGVEEFLSIYTLMPVSIDESNAPFQIGVHSTIGADTLLDGGPPFFFRVHANMADPAKIEENFEAARAVVELQKPAHTDYALTIETPELQIGVHSTVGVDTLIG
jgi:phage tail-like protein